MRTVVGMNYLIGLSIASLVVSIAAVLLVWGLHRQLDLPGVPEQPLMNLSESQVISLVRNNSHCWFTDTLVNSTESTEVIDFKHTESASFRPSGIWVVEAHSSWTVKWLKWSKIDQNS